MHAKIGQLLALRWMEASDALALESSGWLLEASKASAAGSSRRPLLEMGMGHACLDVLLFR